MIKLKESMEDIKQIEEALHDYSTYFIDWEKMYNEHNYKPVFPMSVIKADASLKRLATTLRELIVSKEQHSP